MLANFSINIVLDIYDPSKLERKKIADVLMVAIRERDGSCKLRVRCDAAASGGCLAVCGAVDWC